MSLQHQLALTFIKNIGPTLSKSLLAYFGSVEDIFAVNPSKYLRVPGIGSKLIGQIDLTGALKRAAEEVAFVEKHGIDVIFYTDKRYPKRLKSCNDAPVLLYTKGNMELNAPRVVSIVGTRNATEYGRELCRQLVETLQQYEVLVISGLAYGIDVAAHKECLRLDMPTIGVLGHGLDRLYPGQHRSVADKMMHHGGLLTEYPSGTMPDRENFPQRNRIVAGMADATIVVEAGIKGGALITAEIANSYNRDVFAFPGRVGDTYSAGCNLLVRNHKAAILTDVADVALALGWEKAEDGKPAQHQLALPIDLSESEKLIWETIRENDNLIGIDDLSLKTNMSLSQLAINLLNMEMQGFIRSLPGKTYSIG